MKKPIFFYFILVFNSALISCEKDNPKPIEINSIIEITVKDESGTVVPYIQVQAHNVPPTDPDGKDPDSALLSETTDDVGVVRMTLKDIGNDLASIYFTVVERPLNLEYMLLGSVEVTIPLDKPDKIQKDLKISGRKQAYPFGFVPTVFDSEIAISEYNRWKTISLRNCGDGIRVISDPSNETRVEAIGFGTILAAYAKDKDTFDGLMKFYDAKRTAEAKNMMAWLVTCEGIQDPGSATDGDIDVAFANIVAYTQWGGEYLNKAREILNIISDNLTTECTVGGIQTKVLYPGYSGTAWGGCGMTDIQYYTPGFFRVFAEVTGNAIWDQLADDSYRILNASANATTGLIPDWQTADGDPGPGSRVGHYGYDACRVPWRISLDYLWNGNSDAQQWCTKISNWANGVRSSNIVDGYELNGAPIGTNGLNSAFLGGFTVSMMTNDFENLNSFAGTLEDLNDTYWFNLNTRVLYLFTLTGNFWKPELP